MNPHSFSFNRKMTDLYSELNKINSNSNPMSSKNTFQINPSKKKNYNYSSSISDEKLIMYDLIKRKPKIDSYYSNNNSNIHSKIKDEAKTFLKSRTIFDIPSYDLNNNSLFKNNKRLSSDNYNFKKKYSEIEDYTEYFKTGLKQNNQNKKNGMKNSFRSDLMSSVRIGGNISKVDKLKEDIIDILRNDKLKIAKY